MEQSKALHQLTEAADLVKMIEDLANPAVVQQLSPASWSGMRLTLRAIREAIVSSHNSLAHDYISRSRAQVDMRGNGPIMNDRQAALDNASATAEPMAGAPSSSVLGANGSSKESFTAAASHMGADAARIRMARKDLRGAIEKTLERTP